MLKRPASPAKKLGLERQTGEFGAVTPPQDAASAQQRDQPAPGTESIFSHSYSIFPVRGQPGNDRDYRHPRQRAPKGSKSAANAPDGTAGVGAEGRAAPRPRPPPDPSKPEDVWKHMPPMDDILDAVDRFTKNHFQLGFLSKLQFRDKLRNDHLSVDPFLLLGILGISARMTPALIKRHGSGVKAAEFFMEKQFTIATREVYKGPELARCQAFYLLSLAQQGSGHKNASYVSLTAQKLV